MVMQEETLCSFNWQMHLVLLLPTTPALQFKLIS